MLAGYQPNRIPTPADTAKASKTELNDKTKGKFIEFDIIAEIAIPTKVPIAPPINVIIMASTKNWVVIVFLFAPKALRSPISRVLSVTVAESERHRVTYAEDQHQ